MKNLILIKKWMKINKINFLLVNRTDEFLNEYKNLNLIIDKWPKLLFSS